MTVLPPSPRVSKTAEEEDQNHDEDDPTECAHALPSFLTGDRGYPRLSFCKLAGC